MSKDEFYHDFARRQLERQDSLLSDYQGRAYRIITVAVALLGAAAVTLNLGGSVQSLPIHVFAPLAGLAVGFGLAMVYSIQVLNPRSWRTGVDPKEMVRQLPHYEEAGLREWAADCIIESVTCNDKELKIRGDKLKQGFWALGFEGLCVVGVGVSIALNLGPSVAPPVTA